MATMIPDDIEKFGTEGEKAFFKFLQLVAKPDSDYTCWYLPDVSGKKREAGSEKGGGVRSIMFISQIAIKNVQIQRCLREIGVPVGLGTPMKL
ncbi:MAG: hypothetical protein A2162_07330 [Deltaproteobacteria bacterium RBG_13_52_11b]|nr:MAG: hypothetical protein A2162_07330 [Deltaproteobacteria bacterium RBG_13_52_11b]